jgi:copper chaperone NosL
MSTVPTAVTDAREVPAGPPRIEVFLARATRFFDVPLSWQSRVMALCAALLLIPAILLPLYSMELYSNQFPDGLSLSTYSYRLEGAHTANRDDLREINTLNHYIGMRPLLESDFSEFKWLPLALGGFFILILRAIVIGKMSKLVDLVVMFMYFGGFSLWSFYHRLYQYGHNLDPSAPVKVGPFTPPLFGSQQLGNFTVYNYPGAGSYFLTAAIALLAFAVLRSKPGKAQ